MTKWKWFLTGGVALIGLIAAAEWQPLPPASAHARPLLSGATTPAPVMNVVEHSCQDCHSERTRWPWYARFRPVSEILMTDVTRGRKFLNFSQWDNYSRGQRLGFLTAITADTNNGRMPPQKYTILHPSARLSSVERSLLHSWAKDEALRIRQAARSAAAKPKG